MLFYQFQSLRDPAIEAPVFWNCVAKIPEGFVRYSILFVIKSLLAYCTLVNWLVPMVSGPSFCVTTLASNIRIGYHDHFITEFPLREETVVCKRLQGYLL